MRRKKSKKTNLTTTVLVATAVILVLVLAVVLLTRCTGGKGAAAASSSGSLPGSAAQSAPPASAASLPSSAPQSVAPPVPSVPSLPSQPGSVSSSTSVKPPQPAPVFTAPPAVSLSGKTVTVTYKTDVSSTVNAIISTSSEAVSVAAFYDYFSRGKSAEWAVAKRQVFMVSSGGKTDTFDLPDLKKDYYLFLNAVENETDTWQSTVTVVPLYTGASGSSSSGSASVPPAATP